MTTALVPYTMKECDTCNEGITDAPIYISDTPEQFCSLICAQIFYRRSTKWIWQHRKERP